MRTLRIVSIILGIIGVVMLGVAALLYFRTSSFLSNSRNADGVVVKLDWQYSNKGRVAYPVVEFRDHNGGEQSFQSNAGSNPAAYSVGEKVSVLYDPNDPSDATINSFFSLWFVPILVGGIGSFFAIISSILLWIRRRAIARLRAETPARAAGDPG